MFILAWSLGLGDKISFLWLEFSPAFQKREKYIKKKRKTKIDFKKKKKKGEAASPAWCYSMCLCTPSIKLVHLTYLPLTGIINVALDFSILLVLPVYPVHPSLDSTVWLALAQSPIT